MPKLYLAYGSNLNKRQMRFRCPTARPLGKVMLADAKLVFRGCADIAYSPGDVAPCGLWQIGPEDERNLDAYEGVAGGLYFKEYVELRRKGKPHPQPALIYVMLTDGIYPPSQNYANSIREGYANFGLDTAFLDRAIEESYDEKNPDHQTRQRRERQRRDHKHRNLVRMPESVAMRRLQLMQPEISPVAPPAAQDEAVPTPAGNKE